MVVEAATFGRVLRRQRIAAGLTQEELAERAGLSARGIQDLERGVRRSPHPETVRRLAAALGRPAEPPAGPTLPLIPNSFIGRDAEVGALIEALRTARLVTLTGTGGIGKTRLSLEVARACAAQFPDGMWLIELAPLADGAQVADAVASALEIREQPLRPLVDTLCAALQGQHVLLVFDNCEHVIADAAALIERLLGACAELKVLATSREPLRIDGEHNWQVQPLSVPGKLRRLSPDVLERHGATRLFVERARAAGRDLPPSPRAVEAIATICQKLDGVPLGIELAAARTSMFGVGEIAERLDDALRLLSRGSRTAPERHQSLRGAIEWSYDLLSPAEQTLLERLSVFAGGFTIESAEAVAQQAHMLELLEQLVEKSLVIAEPRGDGARRFRLQEVLRQFARERLLRRGADQLQATRARHAVHFLQEVEQAVSRAFTSDRKATLDRLELELDNFRAARRFFVEQHDAESAQRLCTPLFRMLGYRGHCAEGRASLAEALAIPGGSDVIRGRALHMLGALAYLQADYRTAQRVGEQAVTMHRHLGNPEGLAWSLGSLGSAAIVQANFEPAERLLAEAVEHARRGSDPYILALDLSLWALGAFGRGAFAVARERAAEALGLATAHSYASPGCSALVTLSGCAAADGDIDTAEANLRRALEWAEAVDEPYLAARATVRLARLAMETNRRSEAADFITQSITKVEDVSNPHLMAQALEVTALFVEDADLGARFIASATAIRDAIGAPPSPVEAKLLGEWPPAEAWPLEEAAANALAQTRDAY